MLHIDYPLGISYNYEGSSSIDFIVDKISYMRNWVNLPSSTDDILKSLESVFRNMQQSEEASGQLSNLNLDQ